MHPETWWQRRLIPLGPANILRNWHYRRPSDGNSHRHRLAAARGYCGLNSEASKPRCFRQPWRRMLIRAKIYLANQLAKGHNRRRTTIMPDNPKNSIPKNTGNPPGSSHQRKKTRTTGAGRAIQMPTHMVPSTHKDEKVNV